ncbi:hypothetical protein EBAPG3_15055 [Nitrosospira lacus]|uniref:Uncharacterized protein n=1 Tax=Nitrosospira lacus TaxID=1288494 RepID=A0A1W6SSH1_9PROT|nr:hypothetical protein EBAPG3_15055 [Nitrosospira lacus]
MDPGERSCFEVLDAISLLERIQARSVTVENEDKFFAGIRHRLDAAIFHGQRRNQLHAPLTDARILRP